MLALILGFITGLAGPIAQVINKIADLQAAKVKANSDTQLATINSELEEAHDRKAVLVAEAGNRVSAAMNAGMRFFIASGPAIVLFKLFAWDKAIGSWKGCSGTQAAFDIACQTFRTDPLDAYQWAVITAVVAFYFLYLITAPRK